MSQVFVTSVASVQPCDRDKCEYGISPARQLFTVYLLRTLMGIVNYSLNSIHPFFQSDATVARHTAASRYISYSPLNLGMTM